MSNIIKYEIPQDALTFIEGLDDAGKKAYRDYFYEKSLWESIANESTPLDVVKEREGSYSKELQANVILEYIPEHYTVQELNRLFPGWWTADMKRSELEEIIKLESVIIEGYLCVPYPTPSGTQVRKLWGIAGSKIQFLKDTKIPVDLADNFKGARTEWLRIQGKWLGIGLDIYSQRISNDLRGMFEDLCRALEPLSLLPDDTLKNKVSEMMKIAETLTTGHTFRNYLKEFPSANQLKRFGEALTFINNDAKKVELWTSFLKFSSKSDAARTQTESWLIKFESKIQQLKVKLNKEKQNG